MAVHVPLADLGLQHHLAAAGMGSLRSQVSQLAMLQRAFQVGAQRPIQRQLSQPLKTPPEPSHVAQLLVTRGGVGQIVLQPAVGGTQVANVPRPNNGIICVNSRAVNRSSADMASRRVLRT